MADLIGTLAIEGGTPVRTVALPYGRQWVTERDIEAVANVLRSDWLTTGPKVREFETAFAEVAGTSEAVSVSNGTAALHAAAFALGIGPGDEVIVPAMTFAASANCVVFQGGTPVFVDVDSHSLLIDPSLVQTKITAHTKAIIAVDYAGQPCNYDALRVIADEHGLALVDDAAHALGGSYKDRPVGSLADLSTFSLHPVKIITSGEGGVITTQDPAIAERMRMFRNHGITTDHRQREATGAWSYEMVDLGYNYRLTDFQCALGLRQLANLEEWVARRQAIADKYNAALAELPAVQPLAVRPDVSHAYHLYVVRVKPESLRVDKGKIFAALRAEGINVTVHYVPVHLHPYYRERFNTQAGLCPVAEAAYNEILSLPIFPRMRDEDADDVLEAVWKVTRAYAA